MPPAEEGGNVYVYVYVYVYRMIIIHLAVRECAHYPKSALPISYSPPTVVARRVKDGVHRTVIVERYVYRARSEGRLRTEPSGARRPTLEETA